MSSLATLSSTGRLVRALAALGAALFIASAPAHVGAETKHTGKSTKHTGKSKAAAKKHAASAQAAKHKAAKPQATKPQAAQPQAVKPAAKAPLDGATHDYEYDGLDVGHPERAYRGRAFVHSRAAEAAGKPLPVLVFLHGLNSDGIKFRWMGGGNEGDVRRIVAELIEDGHVPPMLVAAPSSVIPVAVTNAVTSWPAFDLDHFLDLTTERLRGVATIDRSRVIVAGHSGGGCNSAGGLTAAVKGKTRALAALAIDTCMGPDVAAELARANPDTHVIVSWQTMSWAKRPIADFQAVFLRESQKTPPSPGVLRQLEHATPKEPMPHDAMVGLTLKTWLPKLLNPAAAPLPAAPEPHGCD